MNNNVIMQIIFYISLGASLVVYAHANFSTKSQVDKIENKVDRQATIKDIERIEKKIDKLLLHLLSEK
jgi:hypothetical protein